MFTPVVSLLIVQYMLWKKVSIQAVCFAVLLFNFCARNREEEI